MRRPSAAAAIGASRGTRGGSIRDATHGPHTGTDRGGGRGASGGASIHAAHRHAASSTGSSSDKRALSMHQRQEWDALY